MFLWDSPLNVHIDKRKYKAVFFYLIISLAPPMEKPGWATNKRRNRVFIGWRKDKQSVRAGGCKMDINGNHGVFALPTVNFLSLTWFWSKFFQHAWSTSSLVGWSEKAAWAKTSFVAVIRVTAKYAFSLQWEIEKIPFSQTSLSYELFLIIFIIMKVN